MSPLLAPLQLELSFEINESMSVTRRKLLENFDDEVREKLKVRDKASKAFLSRYQLVAAIRGRLQQRVEIQPLFCIRWHLY